MKELKCIFPHLRKRDLREVLATTESVNEAALSLSSFAAEQSGDVKFLIVSHPLINPFTPNHKIHNLLTTPEQMYVSDVQ